MLGWQMWQDVQSDLQRLISCLPDDKGGVLTFNTTGTLTSAAGVFFEKGPVKITSLAAELRRSIGTGPVSNQVVFSCPDPMDSLAFMEIR